MIWFENQINKGLAAASEISQHEYEILLLTNYQQNIDYRFQYLFSIQVTGLIMQILAVIQFNKTIGPLIKIVQKMAGDFINFLIIYIILLMMFSIVGNLNFLFYCPDYGSLFASFVTMMDASMGNYDFEIFDAIDDNPMLKNLGKVYLIVGVLLFTVLILNLIIAILSNTYNIFDPMSKGLYLSKILSSRDEFAYDDNYGSFLTGLSPLNVVFLPLVPIGLVIPPSPKFNRFVMLTQYLVLMMIMFTIFVLFSACILPLAYLSSMVYKIQMIFVSDQTVKYQIIHVLKALVFIIFGIPIMLTTFVADCFYFWINMFRKNLKKIVIERE